MFWARLRSILLCASEPRGGHMGRHRDGFAPEPARRLLRQALVGRRYLPQDPGDGPEPPKPNPAVSAEGGDRLTYGGKVLDPDGKPLSGASVYLDSPLPNGPVLPEAGDQRGGWPLPGDGLAARAHESGDG